MAELLVRRKKKSIWPWVLAVLLIAAAILFFVIGKTDGAANGITPNPTYDSASGQGATKQTPGP
jgi:hypothetical protein